MDQMIYLKMKFMFIIMGIVMAAVLNPAPALEALPTPRAMTRCECAGVSFTEIVRQVYVERRPLAEILGRTGCAQNCGACLPDLQARIAAAR
jgi:bacterioferritin-associated ferredoxin